MDQLYSRTGTPKADEPIGALPQEVSGDGDGAAGVMAALPHRRVHRRSALRSRRAAIPATVTVPAAGAGIAQAVAAAEPLEDRHLRPVGEPSVSPAPRRKRSRRKTLPPPPEPAPGIAQLALDGAVEAAKLPWRVGADLARHAAGSIAGTLRR